MRLLPHLVVVVVLLLLLPLLALPRGTPPTAPSTVSLVSLNAYRDGGPPVAATFALFRWRAGRALFVDVLGSKLDEHRLRLPLPQSTPEVTPVGSGARRHRPGLAGLFGIQCGAHYFEPGLQPGGDGICGGADAGDEGRRIRTSATDRGWAPPEGLIILPRHVCTRDDRSHAHHPGGSLVAALEKHIPDSPPGPGEIVAAILLLWEDGGVRAGARHENVGGILEHALATDVANATTESSWRSAMLNHLRSACAMRPIPRHKQTIWPVAHLIDHKGRPAWENVSLDFEHIEERWAMHDIVVLTDRDRDRQRVPRRDRSKGYAGLPNYCALNGTVNDTTVHGGASPSPHPHIVRALRAYHESAFIESNARLTQFPIPFVDTILEFIIKLVRPD